MSKEKLFTKSAFKEAIRCYTGMYYYGSDSYANQNNEDDFLQALADGGKQAGELARLYYGINSTTFVDTLKTKDALDWTNRLMKTHTVNIAEAAFKWGRCFVRADIIEKKGNEINLIEVKAKSWEEGLPFQKDGETVSGMREYLYDLAFQKYVIQNALHEMYPDANYKVCAYLMLANKSSVAEGPVNQFFRIKKVGKNSSTVVRQPGAEVLLEQEWVLKAFPADDECNGIIEGSAVEQVSKGFLGGQLFKDFVKQKSEWYCNEELHFSPLGEKCFKCPYFANPGDVKEDGKKLCFHHQAGFDKDKVDHPLEEINGTGLTHGERGKLMADGKYRLADIDKTSFNLSKDTKKKYDGRGLTPYHRRLVQVALAGKRCLRTYKDDLIDFDRKFISDDIYLDIDGLKKEMEGWTGPLYMIDFETTSVALPMYEGMRPYEQVAFQYSLHIIDIDPASGDYKIRHAGQYINDKKNFNPNIEFLQHLCKDLGGSKGTGQIFRYSNHENSILRDLRRQLLESRYSGPDKNELIAFIDSITHPTGDELKTDGSLMPGYRDMIDLWDIVKKYYMHKDMKGSNSIKQVLPAVLKSSPFLQDKYGNENRIYGSLEMSSLNIKPADAKDWIVRNADGEIENPYKHLDDLSKISKYLGVTPEELSEFDGGDEDSGDDKIANGGAALAAYTKLQFANEKMTSALKTALLRYCELDTLSMVFIWEYFYFMTH